jgi:hypothetical protein
VTDPRDEGEDLTPVTDLGGTPLSADDDAFVSGLLGTLGSTPAGVPAEVAARWSDAVDAEAEARARNDLPRTTSGLTAVAPPASAIPSQRSSQDAPSGRRQPLRYAGWLAGAAAVALFGGLVINQAAITPSADSDAGPATVAGSTERASTPLPTASTVTTSGVSYTAQNMKDTVAGLVRAGQTPVTLPSDESALEDVAADAPVSQSATTGPVAPATDGPTPEAEALSTSGDLLAAFRADAAQRSGCVTFLADGQSVRTVAVDVGYFNQQPSVLVVLAFPSSPAMLDAYVVDPGCSADGAEIRYFVRVSRP